MIPKVSVIMAVHNGEPYVEQAIKSIINQTEKSIELIVVDDGSKDKTLKLIETQASKENRIKIIKNTENLGLASSLNIGIKAATGPYIARMDHDDIAIKNRLAKQVSYLDANSKIDICGTAVNRVGYEKGRSGVHQSHQRIHTQLLFSNPMYHPTIMFRSKSIKNLDQVYEDGRQRVEDLELWARLIRSHMFSNIDIPLLKYRTYDPINITKRKTVIEHGNIIRKSLIKELYPPLSEEQFTLHMKIVKCKRNNSVQFLHKSAAWLEQLLSANHTAKIYDQDALTFTLSMYWWRICNASSEIGPASWAIYRSNSALSNKKAYNSGKKHFYFYIKSKISLPSRHKPIKTVTKA